MAEGASERSRSPARVRRVETSRALNVLIFHPDADAYVAALSRTDAAIEVRATRDEDEFRRWLPDAEILVARRFPVDALATAKRLRWIQVASTGIEFLLPVRDRVDHLTITNARGVNAALIADYVMAASIMLQSNFLGLMRDQVAMRWRPRSVVPLHGRTLGIVGMGAIGQEVARRARVCGMNVFGVRRGRAPLAEVDRLFRPEDLQAFLGACDFVVLAVPETDSTRAMIGPAELRAMKRSAFIVNVARGSIIDQAALVDALTNGVIAGACLDVFEVEPLPADSPLWTMPNVIVTPHIAGMREDYSERFMDIFIDNLGRFARSAPLRNLVDVNRGY